MDSRPEWLEKELLKPSWDRIVGRRRWSRDFLDELFTVSSEVYNNLGDRQPDRNGRVYANEFTALHTWTTGNYTFGIDTAMTNTAYTGTYITV